MLTHALHVNRIPPDLSEVFRDFFEFDRSLSLAKRVVLENYCKNHLVRLLAGICD